MYMFSLKTVPFITSENVYFTQRKKQNLERLDYDKHAINAIICSILHNQQNYTKQCKHS